MSLAVIFPGQGSQRKGMGAELFEHYTDLIELADSQLGYSLKRLCTDDPDQRLSQTQFTQPALYVVNALSYYRYLEDMGTQPAYVTGHSLGEYNALLAAGVFEFGDGLKLVIKRGEIMGKIENGGMAAVIGMDAPAIRESLELSGIKTIDIANYNSPQQIVISGPKDDLPAASKKLEECGAKLVIPLNVSGAFHSRYMNDAKDQFEDFLNDFVFQPPTIPVISNYAATVYDDNKIKETLANQICNSVRWNDGISYLLDHGVSEFKEIGPGNILTGLVRQIQRANR